jgi:hypothetical protein
MNFLKIKFGNENKNFKAPDNWSEVPFYKFVKFQNKDLKPSEVYELFTNVAAEWWERPHDPKLYVNLDGQLAFLNTEPKLDEIPTHLERGGKFYPIKKDFLNVPLGKYRDLIEITKQLTEESENTLDIMPKMIAVFACIDYEDEEELDKIAKEIEKMPTDIVYSLGCFFLQKLSELKHGTKMRWQKLLKAKISTMITLVLGTLLKSLIIFILCFLSPRVILQSLMQFLRRKWLKFTDSSSFKVVSINQKHYTVD